MATLPTLPGCGQPATILIEIYSAANGVLHGSLDGSVYACEQHGIEAVSAIQAAGFTAYRMPGGDANRCGDGMDFTGPAARPFTAPTTPEATAAPETEHPRWCARGKICTGDGIHHSRPAPVTPRDAWDAVRVWLEQAHTAQRVSVVMETTVDGEVGYVYMTVGQARVLVHQVRRLLDATKGGQR